MKKRRILIAWMLILLLAFSTVSVSGATSESAEPAANDKGKVTLTAVSNSSIKVKWQKEKKYSYYNVYRMAAERKTYQKIATVKGNTYTDKKLKKSTLYRYKVRPYRYIKGKKNYGPYSNANSAIPGADVANYTLTLTQSEDNLDVGVDAGTTDCSANKKIAVIYRSTEEKGTYTKIKELRLKPIRQFWSAAAAVDKKTQAGKTYYYKFKIKKTIAGKIYTSRFSTSKAVCTASINGSVLVDQYTMDLNLDEEDKKLSGDVTMALTNKTSATIHRVCIRNYAASILKSLGKGESIIEKITLDGKGDVEFKSGKDPSVVYADLGEAAMKPGQSVSLTVTYALDIPDTVNRFGYQKDDYGQTFQLSFCFPVLDRYEKGHWNENPYAFGAECTFNRITDYDVTLHMPKDYTVVASGREETEDGVTRIKAKDMRDMGIIVSNCMEKKTKMVDGIQINHYLFKDIAPDPFNVCYMQSAEDAVKLFNETYGRYPYDHLDVVQGYLYGGMEFPGMVLIGVPPLLEDLENPKSMGVYQYLSTLVTHEVGHEWFYAAVGNDQYSEAWLDEGFAEYSASVLYLRSGMEGIKMAIEEDKKRDGDKWYGNEATLTDESFDKYMQSNVDMIMRMMKSKINCSYRDFDDPLDYEMMVYDGGLCFLYELRRTMGDQNFFTAIKEYYKTYCLKEASTEDFLKIIRGHDDSGKVEEVISRYIEE